MSYTLKAKKKPTLGTALGGCLGVLVTGALVVLLQAWVYMVFLGALHHDISAAVPAWGFGQVVLVTASVNLVINGIKYAIGKESK